MNIRSPIVEVGRRTRMRNYRVQRLFESLIEVWSEALARGEKIEIANFLILGLHTITRHGPLGTLLKGDMGIKIPSKRWEVRVRLSKPLRAAIRLKQL